MIDSHFFKFSSAPEAYLQVVWTIVVGAGLAGLVANILQCGLDQFINASPTDMLLSNISNLTLELVAIRGSDEQKPLVRFFYLLSNDNSNNQKLALNYR